MKIKKSFLILIILIVGVAVANFFLLRVTVSSEKENALSRILKQYCKWRDGKMITTGCGFGGCGYKCVLSYSDHGKQCQSSNECKGSCIVVDPKLPEMIFNVPDALKKCQQQSDESFICSNFKITSVCSEFPNIANCGGKWLYLGNNQIKFQAGENCFL